MNKELSIKKYIYKKFNSNITIILLLFSLTLFNCLEKENLKIKEKDNIKNREIINNSNSSKKFNVPQTKSNNKTKQKALIDGILKNINDLLQFINESDNSDPNNHKTNDCNHSNKIIKKKGDDDNDEKIDENKYQYISQEKRKLHLLYDIFKSIINNKIKYEFTKSPLKANPSSPLVEIYFISPKNQISQNLFVYKLLKNLNVDINDNKINKNIDKCIINENREIFLKNFEDQNTKKTIVIRHLTMNNEVATKIYNFIKQQKPLVQILKILPSPIFKSVKTNSYMPTYIQHMVFRNFEAEYTYDSLNLCYNFQHKRYRYTQIHKFMCSDVLYMPKSSILDNFLYLWDKKYQNIPNFLKYLIFQFPTLEGNNKTRTNYLSIIEKFIQDLYNSYPKSKDLSTSQLKKFQNFIENKYKKEYDYTIKCYYESIHKLLNDTMHNTRYKNFYLKLKENQHFAFFINSEISNYGLEMWKYSFVIDIDNLTHVFLQKEALKDTEKNLVSICQENIRDLFIFNDKYNFVFDNAFKIKSSKILEGNVQDFKQKLLRYMNANKQNIKKIVYYNRPNGKYEFIFFIEISQNQQFIINTEVDHQNKNYIIKQRWKQNKKNFIKVYSFSLLWILKNYSNIEFLVGNNILNLPILNKSDITKYRLKLLK